MYSIISSFKTIQRSNKYLQKTTILQQRTAIQRNVLSHFIELAAAFWKERLSRNHQGMKFVSDR